MRPIERLSLFVVWLTLLGSVGTGAFNFRVHPFDPYPKEDPTFLVIDDHGNSHINIDFTTEAYRAPFIFQHRLCQAILLVFLFSSKTIILVHLRNARLRAWLYWMVVICSFLWVWLRLESWTFWITETVFSKVIGDPLCYVMIPTVFFLRDNSRLTNVSLRNLLFRLPLELLLIPVWITAWGIVQLFLLGWVWI